MCDVATGALDAVVAAPGVVTGALGLAGSALDLVGHLAWGGDGIGRSSTEILQSSHGCNSDGVSCGSLGGISRPVDDGSDIYQCDWSS